MLAIDNLPRPLRACLLAHGLTAGLSVVDAGQSAAQVFRLSGQDTSAYLKLGPADLLGGLSHEAEATRWLLGQGIPAPECLYAGSHAGIDYLLTRAIPGRPADDPGWLTDPHRLIDGVAVALRRLHSLDPAHCPFDQRTDMKLRQLADRVARGLVDADDFDPANRGLPPATILNQLRADRPATDDWVVTHGDCGLSNLLLDNWALSGFIDLGELGVGDRNLDLALCLRDLTDALGTDRFTTRFLTAYGLTNPDFDKIRYFRLLDELR